MIALAARFDALGDYVDSKSRSSALMLKVSSLREERKKKQQEEQRRQEEAAARKQQEQADREEQARQRAERDEAERRSREEEKQRRRSRGVALHIGLCAACWVSILFSRSCRASSCAATKHPRRSRIFRRPAA